MNGKTSELYLAQKSSERGHVEPKCAKLEESGENDFYPLEKKATKIASLNLGQTVNDEIAKFFRDSKQKGKQKKQ